MPARFDLTTEQARSIESVTRRSLRAALCFSQQMWLLVKEVPEVFYLMRKFKAKSLPENHPWVTGNVAQPDESSAASKIWAKNIVYRSPLPRRTIQTQAAQFSDELIAEKIGGFLQHMLLRSQAKEEIPHGPKRRMPHAVNYLHGSIHYNGLLLIFNDFRDLLTHLSDRTFRSELRRVVKIERRELTFVFRTRDYSVLELAHCVGAARNYLPWFSNANGPHKKPVLWGNVAPFPAINLINGAWLQDMRTLLEILRSDDSPSLRARKLESLARPPVQAQSYFQNDYSGRQTSFSRMDQLQAWWMSWDVRLRGFRGQLFFTQRKQIEPHRIEEYRAAGGYGRWSACHTVPFPKLRHRDHPHCASEIEPEDAQA